MKTTIVSDYDLKLYVTDSLFEGTLSLHESVLPLEQQNGTVKPIELLYPAEEILAVQSSDLRTVYREGADYFLEDGKLVIPQGSSIATTPYLYYYPAQEDSLTFRRTGGGWIRHLQWPDAHNRQIAVTYRHTASYNGPLPTKKGSNLPRFWQKLRSGETTTMVWYGDSITVGGDTSGLYDGAPFVPIYPKMVDAALRTLVPQSNLTYINTSRGAMTVLWGVEQAEERVCAHHPDLVVIAWGMNWAGLQADSYQEKIRTMIQIIRKTSPQCEFVLVAPMLPNAEAVDFVGAQGDYAAALIELEQQGVVVANMTEIHQYLLTKKRFYDISGNNVNHCNDYLTRWYAQTVLRTIQET